MKPIYKISSWRLSRAVLCLLILAGALHPATLLRLASGGPGGTDSQGNVWQSDAFYSGGAPWTNSPATGLTPPYLNLRYTTSFSYALQVSPGVYNVTLKFIEPNKTGIGQRLFNVSLNGIPVLQSFDLFAAAGLLKPYDRTYPVFSTNGQIAIVLTGVAGNAVISGIQIDDIPIAQPQSFIGGPGITIVSPPPGGGPSIISADSAFIPIYGLGPIASRPAACQAGQIWFATDTPPFVTFCKQPGTPGIWSGGTAAAQILQCQGNGVDPTTGNTWNCAGLFQVSVLGSDSTMHQIVGAAWQMTPAPPYTWVPVVW